MLEVLVERPTGCAFRCLSVHAHERLPSSWSEDYGLALVRRGIVVRQRIDARGDAVAIDVAGAGTAVPLPSPSDHASVAYAADDAMLCLCPRPVLDAAIEGGASVTRDLLRAQEAILARVERFAEIRGRRSGASRVASLLLAIADTLVAAGPIEVIPGGIRQRDLAALSALRHESVCRELRALEEARLVERVAAGLRLVDRAGLERA